MQQPEKTITKPFNIFEVQSQHNYENALVWLEKWGKKQYGQHFHIRQEDKAVLYRLLAYFLRDQPVADQLQINLNKGILLSGSVGVGKTTIMSLLRLFEPVKEQFLMKSCRDVSFEFIKDGYDTIHKYSRQSFQSNTNTPKIYCFDDLGTENSLKYYGNECNIMAEVILSRYDLFISRKLITHFTTNLSASEIENSYGNRIRSRMREMLNLLTFEGENTDKRL